MMRKYPYGLVLGFVRLQAWHTALAKLSLSATCACINILFSGNCLPCMTYGRFYTSTIYIVNTLNVDEVILSVRLFMNGFECYKMMMMDNTRHVRYAI